MESFRVGAIVRSSDPDLPVLVWDSPRIGHRRLETLEGDETMLVLGPSTDHGDNIYEGFQRVITARGTVGWVASGWEMEEVEP